MYELQGEGGGEIYEKLRDWILSRTTRKDPATYFLRKILVIPQEDLPMQPGQLHLYLTRLRLK